MTAYHGTTAPELRQALESLQTQTLPAQRVLMVLDGPVSEAVRRVLAGFAASNLPLDVKALPDNRGSGPASHAGLADIDTEFFARLDSDDYAAPERLERQVAFLRSHPTIAGVGTAMQEFDAHTGAFGAVRTLPISPDSVARYATINSPVNNPSVMLRTAAVREVGGYRNVPKMEDYDLYARLIAGGYKMVNLPEALTYFRVSDAQLTRRTRGMLRAELRMQRNLINYGLVSEPRAAFNVAARMAYRALPKRVLTKAYAALFHR